MYLDFLDTKSGAKMVKVAREDSTYNALYLYWREELFERVMRLFVWEGTGDVPPKEIESRLIIKGHAGITPLNGELTAMWGDFHGVTKYADEFSQYTVRCPIYAGNRTIGKDIVVISNNALRQPVFPLIHHYAMLLAHAEVTLIDSLVNNRDSNGIPVVQTEKQKQSVAEYQGRKFNGQYGSITDAGMLGIDFVQTHATTASDFVSIYETREKILKSFYSDIGVRSSFEKRSNTVTDEVRADDSLLLLNLSDMLDARERACDDVNSLFGTNWSVHVADELNYEKEGDADVHNMGTVQEGDGDRNESPV